MACLSVQNQILQAAVAVCGHMCVHLASFICVPMCYMTICVGVPYSFLCVCVGVARGAICSFGFLTRLAGEST